jgi:Exopolysaccharide biosynthesis protein related to N-acetylglucosamine-1-phosphodiester alpha-N-acetylglucosaminidase
MKKFLRILLGTFLVFIVLSGIAFMVIFHSPYTQLKDLWVTTAMQTMNHKYLAHWFVSDEEIDMIMNRNKVVVPTERVDLSNINISSPSEYDSLSDTDNEDEMTYSHDNTIEKIDIKGDGYQGKLLIVHDPSKVFVGVSDQLGDMGQKLLDMTKSYKVIGGVNAGGFSDPNGHGNGGQAYGLTISEGKYLGVPTDSKIDLVGFTKDNKLVIGSYSLEEIKEMEVRDAVSFSPPLIINGQPTQIIGDGGWGIQPRTAIGQRRDGAILLIVIDGRQISSVGVTIKKLQDIMIEYGAENATNLDGGSSTTMVYKDEIINKPCSSAGPRYLPNSFLIRDISDGKTPKDTLLTTKSNK